MHVSVLASSAAALPRGQARAGLRKLYLRVNGKVDASDVDPATGGINQALADAEPGRRCCHRTVRRAQRRTRRRDREGERRSGIDRNRWVADASCCP